MRAFCALRVASRVTCLDLPSSNRSVDLGMPRESSDARKERKLRDNRQWLSLHRPEYWQGTAAGAVASVEAVAVADAGHVPAPQVEFSPRFGAIALQSEAVAELTQDAAPTRAGDFDASLPKHLESCVVRLQCALALAHGAAADAWESLLIETEGTLTPTMFLRP